MSGNLSNRKSYDVLKAEGFVKVEVRVHWVKYTRGSVAAVLFKTTLKLLNRLFERPNCDKRMYQESTSCTLDRPTPAFCCDSPSLKMTVV